MCVCVCVCVWKEEAAASAAAAVAAAAMDGKRMLEGEKGRRAKAASGEVLGKRDVRRRRRVGGRR